MSKIGRVAGRSLWALAVVSLVVGVVAYAETLPVTGADPVPPVMVAVPAGSTVLVCPGTVRLPTEPEPGEDIAYDPEFDTTPVESLASLGVLTAPPSRQASASRVLVESLGGQGLAQVTPGLSGGDGWFDDADAPAVLRAGATGELPAWLAGSGQAVTTGGDLQGLAAAACQYPQAESWLVGGSTQLGSSARLALLNPGVTAASVTVRVWGPTGPVDLAGAEYLVPPHSERVVLLEGVAAEQRRIVVQTASSGGVVASFLQDSLLRGFVSGGIDQVVAGQGPATRQVVPLSVTESEVDGADVAVLRVLAPGDASGTVGVTFLGPDGPVDLPGTERIAIGAGTVLDVPLGGLPAGEYVAVIDADVPVVAGAMLTRGAGVGDTGSPAAPMDRAWAASVATGSGGPLALPPEARGVLLVAAVPDDDVGGAVVVTVEAIGRDGVLGTEDYRVRGGSTLSIALDDLLPAADDPDSDDPDPASDDPDPGADLVGLVVRTDDPRVAWTVVLLTDDQEMVGVLSPVVPRPAQAQLAVQVR
jgi:hypothetical protein